MPEKADALAAFDAVISGKPAPSGDPALAAFDNAMKPAAITAPATATVTAPAGQKPNIPNFRSATYPETKVSGDVAMGAGVADAVFGSAALATDLATGAPIRYFLKKAGVPLPGAPDSALPATKKTTETIDKAQRAVRRFVGVPDEAITEVPDAAARLGASVLTPLPAGKTKAGVKAVEEIAPKAADELAVAGTKAAELTPVQKVTQALREARPLRREQEAIYTQTRAERFDAAQKAAEEAGGGEAGFKAERQALKGEMPHVQFESIRKQFSQQEVDALFQRLTDADVTHGLKYGQTLTAKSGLAKLLGEYGGHVPQTEELALLKKVFGPEFTDAALAAQPTLQKMKELGIEIANVPRALMASADISAPFRQGLFLGASNPKRFAGAFGDMLKAFASEDAYKAIGEEIAGRPSYDLMKESGLAITDLETVAGREEKFASNLAEKIPGAGPIVRASGRAYTGFLNKLRADVFDDLTAKATAEGLDVTKPQANMFGTQKNLGTAIASFVNAGSGRGDLPKALEGAGQVMNALFFSPKLMASRLTLLNPTYYLRQPAFVRREAAKAMLTFVGAGTTVLSMAKLAGADVGVDPRSADFGKIRVGNTRVDIWGGFQQYVRMASQLASGQYKSTTGGMVKNLGEGYKPVTRYDIAMRQVESKEAPIASFITTMLRQQDYRGQKVNVSNEVLSRFIPMVAQDTWDVIRDNPKLAPAVFAAGAVGMGVQTYQPYGQKPKYDPVGAIKKKFGFGGAPARGGY